MQTKKVLPFVLLLALLFMPFADSAQAVSARSVQPLIPSQEGTPVVSAGVDPSPSGGSGQIQSLSGSYVVFDPSYGGDDEYIPGTTQTLCFRSESYTNDYEYVYSNWLKFPSTWNVTNVTVVGGSPSCDSGASWGTFAWAYQTSPYEVRIDHPRYQQTTDHCVAAYCVEVTSSYAGDPAPVSWYFDGDGYGSAPHNPCSVDGYTPGGQNACDESTLPTADVPTNATGLFFSPESIDDEGCHGEMEQYEVKLYNFTGAQTTVSLTYYQDFWGTFWGPTGFTLPDGAYASFFVDVDPHVCTADRDIFGMIEATDGTDMATFELHKQMYSEKEEWEQLATNSILSMDNVLGAHAGKVWQITGYGVTGVSNYDPLTDTWTAIASSSPPFGQNYARSGCQYGNKVFMYGDTATAGFTGLWSYNMDTNAWTAETPTGTPPPLTGIWAPAWVADPATNICYLTGGANTPGPGTLNTVYVYDPVANAWLTPLPNFSTPRDFHAAFLFDRPADGHTMLCVAGGNYANSGLTSTQCFEFAAGMWYAENADLPTMPASLWAMGYGMVSADEGDDLWLVNGVDATGALPNVTWRLNTSTGIWEDIGPLPTLATYRLSAVTLDDTLYAVGGSTGGFSPSGYTRRYLAEICEECVVPNVYKEATAVALPGERITYTITVPQLPPDTVLIEDQLEDGITYVPGSLTVTPDIGNYYYDDSTKSVNWSFFPPPIPANQWTPVKVSGPSANVNLSLSGVSQGTSPLQSPDQSIIHDVLWDQPLSTVNQNAYASQDFIDFPAYSSFLADDFTANSPWTIESFVVPGNGWNGFTTLFNANQLLFLIYADNMGVPAGDPSGRGDPPLWVLMVPPTDSQISITNGTGGVPSNVQLDLTTPLMLPAGHYWFIFYPSMSFATAGQYGRQPADTTNSYVTQFVNPGGGFGVGTEWQDWYVLQGQPQQDLAFSIYGTAIQSVEISFQADVNWPRGILTNYAFLYYGDMNNFDYADTFTGHGVFLPITMKQ